MKRLFVTLTLVIGVIPSVARETRGDLIDTTFSGNNEFFGNMFDVTTFGKSLNVTAFNVNVESDANAAAVGVSVYTRPGSYVGHDSSSAGWTLVGTAFVTSQGINQATFVDMPDFSLAASTVTGFYVTVVNTAAFPYPAPFMHYTDGANTFANADVRLDLGEGVGPLFQGLGNGSPRTWNGTIFYTAVPEPTSCVLLGIGLLLPAGRVLRRQVFGRRI
jgi:hypothetical protein